MFQVWWGPPSDVTLDASSRRPSYGFGDLDAPGNLDGPADATHQAHKSSDFGPVFSVDWQGMTGWTRFTLPKENITFLAPWKVGFLKKERIVVWKNLHLEETVESPPKKGGFFRCVEIWRASQSAKFIEDKNSINTTWFQLSGECLSFIN